LKRVVVTLKIVDSFTGTEERVKARAKAREERWLEALWFKLTDPFHVILGL
jgi:hypothetical protein